MKRIKGDMVIIENQKFYKISNSDALRPFFMSVVSDSNHWMFIASNGGLTAGRKNADFSLFPYYTEDKITESADITGSKTIFQIHTNEEVLIWEPFSNRQMGVYNCNINIYKSVYGHKIIFEETNHDLGLTYKYEWNSSNRFGFIKKARLINNTKTLKRISVLDGLQNIMPYGVGSDLQNRASNLVDAYKKSELITPTGLGVYALSAIIVDKAEPSEALKATTVWSHGFKNPKHLLSSLQLNDFRKGFEVTQEEDLKAEKGAYFINTFIELNGHSDNKWLFVANVNQSISDINDIQETLKNEKDIANIIQSDIDLGTKKLIALTAASDGLQVTADDLINTKHFANTLFNIMRGGIFDDHYNIEKQDFVSYIANANKKVSKKNEITLNNLPHSFTLKDIKLLAEKTEDKNFKRLCFEYLPLKFSRRHGDPSRPWNKFSINTRSEIDGSKILDYEGNWRDIFQNWEALAHAYPEFIESMIHKFLNATTFDGYNPYRVTKGGFDWEVIEENDPWSYIGYWGDHQIIYLLKFLECIEAHYPGQLETRFNQNIFVYANVPYKIKNYEDLLINPKDTIDFDYDLDEKITQKKIELGADGALLRDENFFIYKVNLIEKLLATLLAKISNFIPEGGIWLNTQRPEWNDANNALVGNGVSVVTLCYLRRFLKFFERLISDSALSAVDISKELRVFFDDVVFTLENNKGILADKISDKDRKKVLDGLGKAGSQYRKTIYKNGFSSDKTIIRKKDLLTFLTISNNYIDHTIEANKRSDNMVHAYNLMTLTSKETVSISYLSEMLEGQVAALSSGYLSPKDALKLLDGLKNSALFREDQYSYILYPNKELPRFDKKNNIPFEKVETSRLLKKLINDGNTQIIEKDGIGKYHFNGNFNNANSLKQALSNLPEQYQSLIKKDQASLLTIFEEVFNHKSFTGRSGTFFGYEGLGSIYWHMVSKLVLAVQENCFEAIKTQQSEAIIGRLLDHYYEIQAGIGVHKSPELYGAFPTDPYSHTPATKGAQQPGMTGQVKEDLLIRYKELGVFVTDGIIHFNPVLLRHQEFLKAPSVFKYVNLQKNTVELMLDKNSLGFTYCQVPVIYKLTNTDRIEVIFNNHKSIIFEGLRLNSEISQSIFERQDQVNKLIIYKAK